MLHISAIERKLKQIKPTLESKFHVSNIGYFGSFSTGTQTINSDLDLLVEFNKAPGWSFFTLEQFLEQELGLRVDIVTKNAIKDRVRETILKQVKYI